MNNKIMISNMVTNAYVGYSMGVVRYPAEFLHTLQNITLATLRQSMRMPAKIMSPSSCLLRKGVVAWSVYLTFRLPLCVPPCFMS